MVMMVVSMIMVGGWGGLLTNVCDASMTNATHLAMMSGITLLTLGAGGATAGMVMTMTMALVMCTVMAMTVAVAMTVTMHLAVRRVRHILLRCCSSRRGRCDQSIDAAVVALATKKRE